MVRASLSIFNAFKFGAHFQPLSLPRQPGWAINIHSCLRRPLSGVIVMAFMKSDTFSARFLRARIRFYFRESIEVSSLSSFTISTPAPPFYGRAEPLFLFFRLFVVLRAVHQTSRQADSSVACVARPDLLFSEFQSSSHCTSLSSSEGREVFRVTRQTKRNDGGGTETKQQKQAENSSIPVNKAAAFKETSTFN